ncbi:hypothetical protein N9413_12395 [Paracoccaceae bacterium]|nr:hypothetical protein [Paracoccaceae bacterium]
MAKKNPERIDTYVMSAQRSGLNWMRTCAETFSGRATPGMRLIHPQPLLDLSPLFLRTHDPSGFKEKSNKAAWRRIGSRAARTGKIAFLIRDPLELFGRAVQLDAEASPPELFFVNLAFFDGLATRDKAAFYYEDFVKEPAAMAELLAFLDIRMVDGSPIEVDILSEHWDELAGQGRSLYDKNQAGAGGSMTRSNPHDFTHHQRRLSSAQLSELNKMSERILDQSARLWISRYGF